MVAIASETTARVVATPINWTNRCLIRTPPSKVSTREVLLCARGAAEAPAVSTNIVQLGTGLRLFAGRGQRSVTLQRRVVVYRVVVGLEVGKFPLKFTGRLVRRLRHRAEHLGFWLVNLTTGEVVEGSVS